MVRIERGFIHYPIAKLLAELFEGFTTCGIVVEVAEDERIVREERESLIEIGNGLRINESLPSL